MKTTSVLFVGICLLVLCTPRISQAQAAVVTSKPFADVPAQHWASQAVDTLQEGDILGGTPLQRVIIGYPDGTYGGKRALSRYEFAAALNRFLGLIRVEDISGYAFQDGADALLRDISNKQAVNIQATATLHTQVNDLQPTMQQLGHDAAAIASRLDALEQ